MSNFDRRKFITASTLGLGTFGAASSLPIQASSSTSSEDVFATFSDLASATSLSGSLTEAQVQALATNNALVFTRVNNNQSKGGGAQYQIWSLQNYRNIAGSSWEPNGITSSYFYSTNYVAIFWAKDYINVLQAGVLMSSNELAQSNLNSSQIEDNTKRLQAAHDLNIAVVYPQGYIRISAPIQLAAGQQVSGQGTTRWNSGGGTKIFNTTTDSGIFWYTEDNSVADTQAPRIYAFELQADFPVKFNDESTAVIADGNGSNVPPLKAPALEYLDIYPKNTTTGIGISWSKCFDGEIKHCIVGNFDINILIQGCDLNNIELNRLQNAGRYHILELSVLTFCSQNTITHNDILLNIDPECTYIKSTSRHARIYNNYIEASENAKGAIDLSEQDSIYFSSNVGNNSEIQRFTTICRDNRIDGQASFSEFVYRYQAQGQTYGEIIDVATTNTYNPKGLVVVEKDTAGTFHEVDYLPVLFDEGRACNYALRSPIFSSLNGFHSTAGQSLTITPQNLAMFGSDLYANGFSDYLRVNNEAIVILPGFDGLGLLTYKTPEDLFEENTSYEVEIILKGEIGDTLQVGFTTDNVGSQLTNIPLNGNGFEHKFVVNSPANQSADRITGLYFSTIANHNIYIQKIQLKKKYLFELKRQSTSSYTYSIDPSIGYTGTIMVIADGAYVMYANYMFQFVNGRIFTLGKQVDNPSVIDLSVSQNGFDITFQVTGTGGSHGIEIYHQP